MKVKLKKGDKIIEREQIAWESNQEFFKGRGYSLVEDKSKVGWFEDKPKKAKSKK